MCPHNKSPTAQMAADITVHSDADTLARAAAELDDAASVVATDDERIASHCQDLGIEVVMTDPNVPSGTDRALAAVDAMGVTPDVVVNLQGDSPFTPPAHVVAVAEAAAKSGADAATPYVRLTWQALDDFRAHKKTTPFSGTTLAHDSAGRALWFSKNLIPAIRKEDALRQQGDMSPVCRHIGLYAYRLPALRKYVSLPEGHYEKLEGLEQLRFLENGMSVQVSRDGGMTWNFYQVDTANWANGAMFEIEPDVVLFAYGGRASPERLRFQIMRLTPTGLEPVKVPRFDQKLDLDSIAALALETTWRFKTDPQKVGTDEDGLHPTRPTATGRRSEQTEAGKHRGTTTTTAAPGIAPS